MKRVPNINKQNVSTKDIILMSARQPAPGQGILYDEMAARFRIMDVVEKSADDCDEYLFEDNDYANLVKYIRATPFTVADRGLFEILEGILKAS